MRAMDRSLSRAFVLLFLCYAGVFLGVVYLAFSVSRDALHLAAWLGVFVTVVLVGFGITELALGIRRLRPLYKAISAAPLALEPGSEPRDLAQLAEAIALALDDSAQRGGQKSPTRTLDETLLLPHDATDKSNPDLMQYRGIRYTIRTRIERQEWYVAIHPHGVEEPGKIVAGSREDAESQAQPMIHAWLRRRGMRIPKRRGKKEVL